MEHLEKLHEDYFKIQKNIPNSKTVASIKQKLNILKKPLTNEEKQTLDLFNAQKNEAESQLEKIKAQIKVLRDLQPNSIKYAQILLDYIFKVDSDLEYDEEIDLETNNLEVFLSKYISPLTIEEKNVIFEYYDPILQKNGHWNFICVLFLFP